jgi:hypothetical protein
MKIWLLFLMPLLLGSCTSAKNAKEVIDPVTYPTRISSNSFEFEVRYSFMGNAGPSSLPFSSKKYFGAYWIYVPKSEGRWSAEDVVITSSKGFLSRPWRLPGLRGFVEITRERMTINVQQPKLLADGVHVEGYEPFFLNGSYLVGWKLEPTGSVR